METFVVSPQEGSSRRRRMILTSVFLYIVFAILGAAVASDFPLIGLLGGLLLVTVVFVIPRWLHSKKFSTWAASHKLELTPTSIVITEPGVKAEIELSRIQKVYVNRRGGNIGSIVLVYNNGSRERLPPYDNIEKLLLYFEQKLGHESIVNKRWLHV